ncbi:MAG: phosphate ABC transporter permease subunit PstC [Caldilineaceae bacterium]
MAEQRSASLTQLSKAERRIGAGDPIFYGLATIFGFAVVALVLIIGLVTWSASTQARSLLGLNFLWATGWAPNRLIFGALPAVYGTLVTSALALLLAAPLGLWIGIYLAELAPLGLRRPLSFLVELLAAIPSVIYGMWGVFVFVPWFRATVAAPVASTIGTVAPLLSGPVAAGRSLAVAGIILAIMILPTIAAITRDVLTVVPQHQREAMLALGATRWETIWKAVVPYSRAAIIGGVMLGLGRALGETMAALLVIGGVKNAVPISLFAPGISIAPLIASELANANSEMHESVLILMALVLFVITLILNGLARLLVWYAGRGPGKQKV